MQGKQMKIELVNHEFHTNMVETGFFSLLLLHL